jgi:hypothetical protein
MAVLADSRPARRRVPKDLASMTSTLSFALVLLAACDTSKRSASTPPPSPRTMGSSSVRAVAAWADAGAQRLVVDIDNPTEPETWFSIAHPLCVASDGVLGICSSSDGGAGIACRGATFVSTTRSPSGGVEAVLDVDPRRGAVYLQLVTVAWGTTLTGTHTLAVTTTER